MDPLSVMASVVGLLAAAAQVVSALTTVKSSIKDAPRSMDLVLSQVNELAISLSAVHKLLLGINSAPKRRLSLIQVDQLVATLTEAVLTFSELEAMVSSATKMVPLAESPEVSMLDRIKWAWKEDAVSAVIVRMERHKSSISLMLNIVQW